MPLLVSNTFFIDLITETFLDVVKEKKKSSLISITYITISLQKVSLDELQPFDFQKTIKFIKKTFYYLYDINLWKCSKENRQFITTNFNKKKCP